MVTMQMSAILGEFDVKNDITILSRNRPKLKPFKFGYLSRKVDLKTGFDLNEEYETSHGIHHIFNYVNNTKIMSNLYKDFNDTKYLFVCGRYILTKLEKFARGVEESFEILAFRRGNVVYIGSNRTLAKNRVVNPKHKLSIYAGLNFGKYFTYNNNIKNSGDTHSIVRNIRLNDSSTESTHSLLVSSTVRAFDDKSNPIELHTKCERKSFKRCMIDWSFSAVLAGSSKIIYGLRNNDYELTSICHTEKILTDHSDALNVIHKTLTRITNLIENESCVLITPIYGQRELSFQKVDIGYMNKSDQW
ncbi:unnamed protein product [Caenorhabditis angaria]|uniref:Decapping nuclease n=1 Tax=Caenorhabditis angaria TaxID=860376 RepID=A0A9P1IEM2_9PELO|nr:unnamed protein product [Caenorhabditis angaria]